MIRPTLVTKQSPFLGEECALCKELLSPGEEIIICPEDGSRHHVHCWRANGNQCSAYRCPGAGEIGFDAEETEAETNPEPAEAAPFATPRRRGWLRFPGSLGCAQSCLILSIALAIVVIAFSCFGLWAIADYIMMEVLGWRYRQPLSGMEIGVATAVVYLQLSIFD